MTARRRLALLVFLAASTAAARAGAGGIDPSLALLAGYGESTEPNVLGPGLGLRAGGSFAGGVYLGALALAHYGSSDEWEPSVRHHVQSLRAELGYGFDLSDVELRPTLRFGAARVTTARDVDGSFGSPDLGLGLTLLVPVDHVRLGLDAEGRVFTRMVDNWDNYSSISSLAAYAVAGYAF